MFVLERIEGVWTDVQTIQSPDPGYSEFGASVTLALPYLAIGAPDSDAVEVYEFTGTQFDPLRTYNGPAGSRFGESVSAASGRLAVGAPLYDDTRTDVGAVDLFVLATATTVADVRLSDGSDGDLFGSTVALTDADLWIAALGDDGPTDTEPDTGVVRRYDSGGNFASLEVRAAGVGTGSTISAVNGRAAIATAVSTDVVVFDTGIGARTLSGVSQGFGNQLAMTAAGERLYIADAGTSETFVYDRSLLSGLFSQSATLPSVDPSLVTSLAADGSRVVRGLSGTGTVSSGLDAAAFDVAPLPEVPVELDFASSSVPVRRQHSQLLHPALLSIRSIEG